MGKRETKGGMQGEGQGKKKEPEVGSHFSSTDGFGHKRQYFKIAVF